MRDPHSAYYLTPAILCAEEKIPLATRGLDYRHEEAAHTWLARYFSPAVIEPIHRHVVPKRYRCAIDDRCLAGLSPASRRSLVLQGGPMTTDEIAISESIPVHQDAV